MSNPSSSTLKTVFSFGHARVEIVGGNIVDPPVEIDALVSTDDNYLTMSSGVSARLREKAASKHYVRSAQVQCPVEAGTVIVTKPYGLARIKNVKWVLHGTVIDYDAEDLQPQELVYRTTYNCLAQAEELAREGQLPQGSILFPAFAAGSGGLGMEESAREMCRAIKAFLAQERLLGQVYIILHLSKADVGDATPGDTEVIARKEKHQRFIREATLVLGTPYNPALGARQSRDFYGRQRDLGRLQALLVGQEDDERGKRHAVILGGPDIGKQALLDRLFSWARQNASVLGEGRRAAKVTFGRVHKNTPSSFIYRKFLCALAQFEQDEGLQADIRAAYANPNLDCDGFLDFLEAHQESYSEVVFLIDQLPRLLRIDPDKDASASVGVQTIWADLDRLQERVRFVYTAQDDEYQELLEKRLDLLTETFKHRITEIRLKCLTDQERSSWVNELFECYLGRDATDAEQRFFRMEAGQHPFLISLVGYSLVSKIVQGRSNGPERGLAPPDRLLPEGFFHEVHSDIEGPRRKFFARLVDGLDQEHRIDLVNLAQAVAIEYEQQLLVASIQGGDPNAISRWQELQEQGNPREYLHDERLDRLEKWGYLAVLAPTADKAKEARFMAEPFAAYVSEFLDDLRPDRDQLTDVVISLLGQGAEEIRTMFHGRSPRVISAQKRLLQESKDEFTRGFGAYIDHRLHPGRYPDPGPFQDIEEISNFILAQFTNVAIKRYLSSAPEGSTIHLIVDDAHKDIPWELMLEAVYAGPIPFRVGRTIVSQREPHNIHSPVRGLSRIKALLIGDPTSDLPEARREVNELAARFQEAHILIGSEQCQRIRILNALASGNYGLVHYSGHTRFENDQSAWQLEHSTITTDMLTNAVQMAPPAFIFSSSCESARGSGMQPVRYEDQTFDLPSAFLQAGVEAYVGTLWGVDSGAARVFTSAFYDAFFSGEHTLGECLRRAKWELKQQEEREGLLNWLAYVLYSDPHTRPGDLFPVMRGGG